MILFKYFKGLFPVRKLKRNSHPLLGISEHCHSPTQKKKNVINTTDITIINKNLYQHNFLFKNFIQISKDLIYQYRATRPRSLVAGSPHIQTSPSLTFLTLRLPLSMDFYVINSNKNHFNILTQMCKLQGVLSIAN